MAEASTSELLAEAQRASAAGAAARAIELLRSALALEPDNPQILNMLANRLCSAGEPDSACELFRRATEIVPDAAELWLNLAGAERFRRDWEGEERALNRALAVEPYFLAALLQRGELYERLERESDAARSFSAVLTIVSQLDNIPPALQPRLQHANDFVGKHRAALTERIRKATERTAARSPRFDYCLDVLSGRQRIYLPQPTRLYFPGLPAVAFFDRALFPWFDQLEAATDIIRGELLAVMAADSGMRPYIDSAEADPVNQWDKLNRSLDWSAFFLWENGVRNESNCAACPETAALVEQLPLFTVPRHAPTAMFSILRPGAHIPPHTGDSNMRAVVHLPLVVPPDCAFRVGAEERPWVEGVASAFDDTIEHEAWNRSAQARAILIVDAWNPYLTEDERELLSAAEQVLKSGDAPS